MFRSLIQEWKNSEEDGSKEDEEESIEEVEEGTTLSINNFVTTVPSNLVGTFADCILKKWYGCVPHFLRDIAVAAYICSPVKCIQDHTKANITADHRGQAERLLRKLIGETKATAVDQTIEDGRVINTFWKEHTMFWARVGPQFSNAWIYVDPDLHDKPHIWHQTNSLPYTLIFGQFACRVCSKIVGIGSDERVWGAVKKLKDNQRSHMGATSVMKQATLYGACCSKKAQNKMKETGRDIIYWEEEDFKNLGLDKYLIDIDMVTGKTKETRTFFAFIQDWEKEAIDVRSNNNEIMLHRKYGGLKY
jgi:hypothetical protein